MAYYYKDGSGIDSSAYIYVQLQVTRTDYPTYSHFVVKSVAVSDTGTSSFNIIAADAQLAAALEVVAQRVSGRRRMGVA